MNWIKWDSKDSNTWPEDYARVLLAITFVPDEGEQKDNEITYELSCFWNECEFPFIDLEYFPEDINIEAWSYFEEYKP